MREAARLVRERAVSPVELTRACIDRIREHDAELVRLITVLEESALEQAKRAEQAVMRKDALGPLHGVPLALKDCFAIRGVRTTGGSRLLAENIAGSPIAQWLSGYAMLAACSWGRSTCTSSPLAPPRRTRTTASRAILGSATVLLGGSSGGSAIAVAASLCLGSMGTDAGGSVRLPAALCGIVGLKPTYGRISRYGTLPLSLSLDHSGPMTRSVADAALMLQIVAGPDPTRRYLQRTSRFKLSEALTGQIKGLRILTPGVPGGCHGR